jgi:hypothetical protein
MGMTGLTLLTALTGGKRGREKLKAENCNAEN